MRILTFILLHPCKTIPKTTAKAKTATLKLSNIEPGQPGMSSRLERLFNQNLAYLLWYPHSIPITCGILDHCQKTWSSAGSYNLPLIANDSSTSSYPSMVGRNRLENMANVHLGLVFGCLAAIHYKGLSLKLSRRLRRMGFTAKDAFALTFLLKNSLRGCLRGFFFCRHVLAACDGISISFCVRR